MANADTFIDASSSGQTLGGVVSGAGTLAVNGSGAALTLTATNGYAGPTMVALGTLYLSGNGSISNSSSITISNGGTFDVSGESAPFFLAANQNLAGGGIVNGTLTASPASQIYAGNDPSVGTLTFNNGLTLPSGSSVKFDVSTSSASGNDQMAVAGALTLNSNAVHIKALSPAQPLATADYVLMTAGSISGNFNPAVSFDVPPSNPGHYTVLTNTTVIPNQVLLHYSEFVAPKITGSASPSTVSANESTVITATVTQGSGSITNVNVLVGGVQVNLVQSNGTSVYTNTIIVPAASAIGTLTLTATATDTTPESGAANITLNVVATTEIWDGGANPNENWSGGANWLSTFAPGFVGDSFIFAGNTGTAPNMDNNYAIAGLSFASGAASFNIGSTGNYTLTLAGSPVVNNSTSAQTINVPITLNAAQTFTAAAGNLTLAGAIADSGTGLSVAGPYTVTLSGNNAYTGQTTVSSGTLNVTGSLAANANILMVGSATEATNATLEFSGSIGQENNMYIGNFTNGSGAVYQTGGSLTLNGGGGDVLDIGNIAGAYGYYDAAGGTLTANGIGIAGEGNSTLNATKEGNGIMDISGGTVTDTGWVVVCRCTGADAQIGVLNVYSGTLTFLGGGLVCNWGTGQTSILNVMGGTLSTTGNLPINLNTAASGANTGIMNLMGGVAQAGWVDGGANNTYVNFNGGTLQANESQAFMLTGMAGVYIYSGGATFNNNGYPITVGQALLAPTGNGVNTIASSTPGAGYNAPPIVIISGGGGAGATAIAQIDTNGASGSFGEVTNVLITSPGVNYSSAPTFTLSGGGGVTPATITGAAPTPNISGGLTATGSGTLTLTGASTYTGATTIASGSDLLMGEGGSLNNSSLINVQSGGTFDASAISPFSLSAGQNVEGGGSINGVVVTGSGSKIFPGTDGTVGTLTFSSGLTMSGGSTANFDLSSTSTSDGGVNNDSITVNGPLILNDNVLHIKGSTLDTTTGNYYTLFTCSSTPQGNFASTPVWDSGAPANAQDYTVQTVGNNIELVYSVLIGPSGVGISSPRSGVLRNQTVTVTVGVAPGTSPTITSVAIAVGGGTTYLTQVGATTNWTGTVIVPPTILPGSATLTATITDAANQTGTANINFGVSASTEVWSGSDSAGNENFDDNNDWVSTFAPGYVGDSLTFGGTGGTAGPNPNMDNNYTVSSLTFNSGATSFDLGSLNNSTLTLTGTPVVNNSTSAQTLNVALNLTVAQPFDATAGNIIVGGAVADTGNGLSVVGPNTVTLAGNNTYTGPTVVSSGTLNIADAGTVANTTSIMLVGDTSAQVASQRSLILRLGAND